MNMAMNQYDCTISRRQVTDIAGFAAIATSMHEARLITGGKMSDPDEMINYFTKMDIPHIVLSHEKNIELFEFKGQTLKCIKSETTRSKENEVTIIGEENGNIHPKRSSPLISTLL